MSEQKTTTTARLVQQNETTAEKFYKVIVETAHEHGLCVRELEAACEKALLFCREVPVPHVAMDCIDDPRITEEDRIQCSVCGRAVSRKWKYCVRCGSKIEDPRKIEV